MIRKAKSYLFTKTRTAVLNWLKDVFVFSRCNRCVLPTLLARLSFVKHINLAFVCLKKMSKKGLKTVIVSGRFVLERVTVLLGLP